MISRLAAAAPWVTQVFNVFWNLNTLCNKYFEAAVRMWEVIAGSKTAAPSDDGGGQGNHNYGGRRQDVSSDRVNKHRPRHVSDVWRCHTILRKSTSFSLLRVSYYSPFQTSSNIAYMFALGGVPRRTGQFWRLPWIIMLLARPRLFWNKKSRRRDRF